MNRFNLLNTLRRLLGRGEHVPRTAYSYRVGDTVVEDYAEFSGMPLADVIARITNCRRINAEDWSGLVSESFARRAAKFYEASGNFVFDTLSANPRPQAVIDKLNRFNPAILTAIRAHPGQRLFEFGGGIGVFCEIASRMGKKVYYLELPGIVFRFATWRFRKLGLSVTPIEAKADVIAVPGRYDIVYTDAVLEHLPPPLQLEATRAIGDSVGEKGLLVFMVDLSGPTEDEPMHHEVDIAALHHLLADSGLSCNSGLNTFCSLWRRP